MRGRAGRRVGAARGPWLGAPPGGPAAGRRPGPRGAPPPARARARAPRAPPGDPQAALDLVPEAFALRVRLEDTGELFRVPDCRGDTTVRQLKEHLELLAGVPFNLQQLRFLDQGILTDDTTLKFHDIVPGAVISLCVWHYDGWADLVVAAVEGDPSKLNCLGLTENSLYRTANSRSFEGETMKQWASQRAFVALYVASHRGHHEAVKQLLEQGASCSGRSPLGRTPLHVAAAMGRLECINLLMERGASIHDKDAHGETPVGVARRLHRKQSERRMFLLHWLTRSGVRDFKTAFTKEAFKRASSMVRRKRMVHS